MKYLDYPFAVATASSRRPTPTKYVHLRKWAPKDEKFLSIHNQQELTNLTQQLEQTINLQVSNIFQRTLSYIFGETDLGPRIIKGTLDGALHVAIDGLLSDTKNLLPAKIDVATAADHTIVAGSTGQKIHVVNLIFTVAGEVNIILKSGTNELTGPMDFGGTDEPRGAVTPLGLGPLVCNSGEPFVINLNADIQTSGFITYYKQIA